MKKSINKTLDPESLLRRDWEGLTPPQEGKGEAVRWGIIGVGKVTEVKSGPAFYKVANSSLVAVMRRSEGAVKDYAKRHGIAKWYTDATQLINDPAVNAIYIATPPDSHARYAIEAMRAGKPVYVEKPMARTFKECQEILKVSEETGMPLFVAYYRRALPAFLKAKELIESGAIGKPLIVNITLYKEARERNLSKEEMSWHVFPEISGAGHFYDLASHQFDFLDFVFGKVTGVKGTAVNLGGLYPAEDTVTGTWKHESGVIGKGSWCFIAGENSVTDEIEIIGQQGVITLPCFAPGNLRLKTSSGIMEMGFNNPEHISQNLVDQVVKDLRGEMQCASTGLSAARTSWVLEEMVKEYYKGNRD